MVYLITRWFGVFLYDDGKVIDKRLFPKDSNEIAKRLYKIYKGEVLEEEASFKDVKPDVTTPRLRGMGKLDDGVRIKIDYRDYGYTINMLKDACIKVAEKRIKEEGMERHRNSGEAKNGLDDK